MLWRRHAFWCSMPDMINRLTGLVCFAAAALASQPAEVSPPESVRPKVVYVIPVNGMIERALVYAIRRGIEQAGRDGATAIILDMDTPGGRMDACEDIVNLLGDLKIPTYTYVNPNAISAGAIIAMATDHIYMSPAGRIGDAMPLLMSPLPFSGPQAIPEDLKEKFLSPTEALIRSAAQRKGHDPALAAAMVRADREYKVGDRIICEKGHILTLTAADAAERFGPDGSPLLSEGTMETLEDLLRATGLSDASVRRIEITGAERIARFIESFPVSGLLLALGLLALYIEFKTPGFGLPGITGIALLAIWFWGHHIAGLAGAGEILLFVAGLVLLVVEIFFVPGFGVPGIAGIILMIAALVMAMLQHYPDRPWYEPPAWQFTQLIKNLSFASILIAAAILVLAKYLPKTSLFHRVALQTAVSASHGFQAAEPKKDLIGARGVALSQLRPSGVAEIGNQRLDVIARDGQFIQQGAAIIVADVQGSRIVVDVAAGEASTPHNKGEAA